MAPKTQAGMEYRFKSMDASKRMSEALRRVVTEDWTQAEAARRYGVSRPRLNEKVKQWKADQAEKEARSAAARQERAGTGPAVTEPLDSGAAQPDSGGSYAPVNETRRVPSLVEFNELYFGNVLCGDCGDIRHETPGFHKEMLEKLGDESVKRLLINVAPFHAKSTVATLRATLWDIVKDPNVRVAIVSKTQRLAENFVDQIVNHLSDTDLYTGAARNLIDDYGPFLDGSTQQSRKQIAVLGRIGRDKDPTVAAFGLGSALYGWRFDKMRMDDIWDLENSKNPDRVAYDVKWITTMASSRVGKAGRLDIIGTRVGPQDGYSKLQDLPGYEVIRYPCIIDEPTGLTLWPEHFGIDAAKHQRSSMMPEEWQLIYQNADTLGSDADFTQEMIEKARDPERFLGQFDPNLALVAGLDPAGANKQSGYTAMVLLGVDLSTGRRYLVDMVNALQLKAPDLKAQLFAWAEQYRGALRELRVESNGLQSQLVQYNDEINQRLTSTGVRVVPHITTKHNKWDANFGVQSLAPMFYNGQISTPWGDINARRRVGELEQQLLQFPIGQVTDLYMALWFAELGCRDLHRRAQLPAFDNRMKLPSRLARKRHVVDFGSRSVRRPSDDELSGAGGMWEAPSTAGPRRLVNMD